MAPLFYASLEKHMRTYMKDVELNQFNIEFQAMQNKIVREGNRMALTQAEIQNKLEQLQEELANSIINKKIKFDITAAKNSPPDDDADGPKNSSMTPAQYENIINKKPNMTLNKRIPVYQNQSLINELKEKLQSRKQTVMLTEVFPEVNKRNVNQLLDNVLTDLISSGLKKSEVKKGAETVVDELLRNASGINSKEEINEAIGSIIDSVVKNQFPSNTIGKTDNPMTLKIKLKADYKAAGIPLPDELKKKGSVKIEVLEQLSRKLNKKM